MESIFKKGDEVFDIRYGHGIIYEINNGNIYPILVKFYPYGKVAYNEKGFHSTGDNHAMLSFTEYTLQGFSQERPKKEYPIGTEGVFSRKDNSGNRILGELAEIDSSHIQLKYMSKTGFWYEKFISLEDYIEQRNSK